MAFKPNGVAAFPSPSMLVAKFITMAPMAGWSAGTSGNKRRISGAISWEIQRSMPPWRATPIRPRKTTMVPVSAITRSTALRAESKIEADTACMFPA